MVLYLRHLSARECYRVVYKQVLSTSLYDRPIMKPGIRNHQVLFYNYSERLNGNVTGDLTVVNSPATCLQRITRQTYELIIIFPKFRSLNEHLALIELCSTLKKSRYSKHVPLLCILPSKHRELLEQLQNVGVDYVRFYFRNDAAAKIPIESLLVKPTEDCAVARILSEICPHINYFPISRHQEILYCGAYRNRLVLGPHRLRHSCETMNHNNCEYFKCPKL